MLAFLGMAANCGVAGLLYGIALVRDMKIVLKSTNESAMTGEQNKLHTSQKLYEFINIHAMVKELSVDSNSLIRSNG